MGFVININVRGADNVRKLAQLISEVVERTTNQKVQLVIRDTTAITKQIQNRQNELEHKLLR